MTQRRADVLLMCISIIWGTTFTVVYAVVANFPPLALIALRFGCAAAVFLPLLVQRRDQVCRQQLKVGLLLGSVLFAGFATQTLGLQYTTPTRAGFITGLNVVLVPLLGLLVGQRPPLQAVLGVAFAVIGLAVLSWGCQLPWLRCAADLGSMPRHHIGDILVLACAFAFALHIVAISRWATTLPVVTTNTIQLIVVALLAAGIALLTEWPIPSPSLPTLAAVLFLGLIATAFVFALQLRVQRYTTATHTGLIFALEPVFAAFFAWLWVGEVITAAVLLGGGLMLAGMLVAELPLLRRRTAVRAQPAADHAMLDPKV